MNLVPMEVAAVSSDVVEESGDGVRPQWIMREGKLPRAAERNPFLDWETGVNVPVRIWRLRDVVLDGDSMVLMSRQGVLSETKYTMPPDRIAALGINRSKLVSLDPGRYMSSAATSGQPTTTIFCRTSCQVSRQR